jgi:hypothetical protein
MDPTKLAETIVEAIEAANASHGYVKRDAAERLAEVLTSKIEEMVREAIAEHVMMSHEE